MPFLIDRSCPEWQKRDRQHRRVANRVLIGFFTLILVGAMAIDFLFPPVVEPAVAEQVAAD